mgnify:CR=1 FL=1
MAGYSQVYKTFWQDNFVLSLPFQEKAFYIYLFTNAKINLTGIYETSLAVMEFETGLSEKVILNLLDKFEQYGKVKFSKDTSEICITNYIKYNLNRSPRTLKAFERQLNQVKDKSLIPLLQGIEDVEGIVVNGVDLDSIEEYRKEITTQAEAEKQIKQAKETDKQKRKPPIPYKEIVNMYNDICISLPKVKKVTEDRKKMIKKRYDEGFTFDDFRTIFTNAENSDFLKGNGTNNWQASFNWLVGSDKTANVLEGNYNKSNTTNTQNISQQSNNLFMDIATGGVYQNE